MPRPGASREGANEGNEEGEDEMDALMNGRVGEGGTLDAAHSLSRASLESGKSFEPLARMHQQQQQLLEREMQVRERQREKRQREWLREKRE